MSEWKKVFETNISLYCRIIIQYLIESGWKSISIDEYTKKMPDFPVKNAVQSKLYKKEGLFPIVSQSKDLISGFSDDEQLLNKISKPIIIFGDHTQVVKYIDFDFVLGADGTKILTVTNDYNPKFIYYLIKSIDLHSNKYARHYSKLRKEKIPFQENSLAIQHKIASFLDSLENNNISNESYFDKETEKKILSLQKNSLNIQRIEKEIESQKNYIKQLRQNILQEAIEGKLTADWRKKNPVQKGNPDYDAEALFEQIQKEKYHTDSILLTQNQNKKKKRKSLDFPNPCDNEEKPFAIPDGWKWVRLGELSISSMAGKSFACEGRAVTANEWGIIKTSAITSGIFVESENKFYSETKPVEIFTKINSGDFLFCRASGSKGLAGKSCIVEKINSNLLLSDKSIRIELYPEIKTHYINMLNNSFYGDNYRLSLETNKSTTMNNLTREQILNFVVPLPPLAEQKEIVTRVEKNLQTVSDLENQITEREQLTKQLMQSILKDAFEEE